MNTQVFPVPTGLSVQEIMFTHARRLAPIVDSVAGFVYDPVAGTLTLTLRDSVETVIEVQRRSGFTLAPTADVNRLENKIDALATAFGDDDANPITPTILQRLKALFVKSSV